MKLMTKTIAKQLPTLYSTEHIPADKKKVICKFFDPMGSWTWYALEACALVKKEHGDYTQKALNEVDQYEDILFFGYVKGFDNEFGYFQLSELEAVGKNRILGIERDLHFKPTLLSEFL